MINLTCIESYIDKEQNHSGCFLIEPLDMGQGITLGNSLRRTLLSDIPGLTITGTRINNIKHEFSILEGLREDPLEIISNLKEIVLKENLLVKDKKKTLKTTAFLHEKGPKILTAGLFKLPNEKLKILNPNQYLCTILNGSEFYCEIDIENGKGYKILEESRQKLKNQYLSRLKKMKPSTLLVDANFTPIKKVNFKIKLIHDNLGNIKESLFLEIITNGSISPKRSLQESFKIILNLLIPLITNSSFLTLSSEFFEKWMKEREELEINETKE